MSIYLSLRIVTTRSQLSGRRWTSEQENAPRASAPRALNVFAAGQRSGGILPPLNHNYGGEMQPLPANIITEKTTLQLVTAATDR